MTSLPFVKRTGFGSRVCLQRAGETSPAREGDTKLEKHNVSNPSRRSDAKQGPPWFRGGSRCPPRWCQL